MGFKKFYTSKMKKQVSYSCIVFSIFMGVLLLGCTIVIAASSSDQNTRNGSTGKSAANTVYSKLSPVNLLEQADKELNLGRPGQAYLTAGKALSLLIMSEKSGKSENSSVLRSRAISIMKRAAEQLVKNNPTGDDKVLQLGNSKNE